MVEEHGQLAVHNAAEGKTTDRNGSASHAVTSNIQDAELQDAETHRSRNRAQVEVLALHLEPAVAER